jgi:hypothetical protein
VDESESTSKTVDPHSRIVTGARALVDVVAPKLDQFADQVWCFGILGTPDERRALGLVAQMAAELMIGAATMYEAGRFYAGASLVRQLIEVDYLLFLFGSDAGEASRWINGTPEDLKKLFQPAAMRKRSGDRFDVDEYSRHCEMGGHPRPAARSLVDRHHLVTPNPAWVLWTDFANHIVRLWNHYKLAAERCSPNNVYPDRWAPLDAACDAWWNGMREHRSAAQQGVATDGASRRS